MYYINKFFEKEIITKMEYFISFIDGFVTFISPCMLPMLPIYVSYFAGSKGGNGKRALINSLGFVSGFTTVFVLMGVLAGSLGRLLYQYANIVNIVGGAIMVLLGLGFMEIIPLKLLQLGKGRKMNTEGLNFFSSAIFGVVFSISWTPCVSVFLGSALMLAANSQTVMQGGIMLLLYSLGLGIPFVISAVLIDKMKETFNFIKKNYGIINKVAGSLLVIMGVMMIFGYFNTFLSFFQVL